MEVTEKNKIIFNNKYLIFVLFIIINLPLIIFFFDYFNLNVTINGASYLYLGMNPYVSGSKIVAAYLILPYNLLSFFLYSISSFSIPVTYIFLKVFGLAFIYLTGFVLWKGFSKEPGPSRYLLVGIIVLNPLILLNNDLSLSTTFIPLFFTLLSYYMLYRSTINENIAFAISAFSLLISGFTYYFPFLVLPALLIYLPSNKKRIKFFSLFVIEAILVWVPSQIFQLSSSFVGTLSSGSAFFYPYSILNLLPLPGQVFILHTQIFVTIIILSVALFIPIILKKLSYSLPFSLIVILLIPLLIQPSGTYPDSFLVLVPFEFIILARSSAIKLSYLNSLIPQLFIVPQFIIGQLMNGPGYVTGIFYNLYTILHENILIYYRIPYPETIWKLLLVLTLLLALFGIIYLAQLDRKKKKLEEKEFIYKRRRNFTRLSRIKKGTLIALILFFFLIFPTSVPGSLPNTNSITSNNTFPAMLFSPVSGSGLYIMPAPSTYQYSGPTVSFSSQASQLYLERNLSGQNLLMNFSLTGFNGTLTPSPSAYEVFSTNQFIVGLKDIANVTNVTGILPMVSNNNITMDGAQGSTVFNNAGFVGRTSVYNISRNSTIIYNATSVLTKNETILFSARILNYSAEKNIIWTLNYGNSRIQLFTMGKSLYFTTQLNNASSLGTEMLEREFNLPVNNWSVGGISFSGSGQEMLAFFDGWEFSSSLVPVNNASVFITFGKINSNVAFDGSQSINGSVSSIYVMSSLKSASLISIVVSDTTNKSQYMLPYSPLINIYVQANQSSTNILVNKELFHSSIELKNVAFGKLSSNDIGVGLVFNFSYIKIAAPAIVPNYLLIVLSSALIGPILFFSPVILVKKKSQGGAEI